MNRSDRAGKLAVYLERRLKKVEDAIAGATHRPRVYYAMGKPLFCINGGRLENELVTVAGGLSVNRELPDCGRPGRTLDVDTVRTLQPDVIFISAFISNTVEDFMRECLELGLNVRAVNTRQIHTFPAHPAGTSEARAGFWDSCTSPTPCTPNAVGSTSWPRRSPCIAVSMEYPSTRPT